MFGQEDFVWMPTTKILHRGLKEKNLNEIIRRLIKYILHTILIATLLNYGPCNKLTHKEIEICDHIKPALKDEGLFFVGIDVIGGMLSEINVTSPTGIREVENLMNIPLADQVINYLIDHLNN